MSDQHKEPPHLEDKTAPRKRIEDHSGAADSAADDGGGKDDSKDEEQHSAAGWLQLVFVVLFLVTAFGFSYYLASLREQPQASPETKAFEMTVTTIDVAAQKAQITFRATGSVAVNSYTNIVPQVSGEIVRVRDDFYAGGYFKAQEDLFQINPADYLNDVKRLHAEVARARTNLKLQEAEALTAPREWKKLNPGRDVPPLVAKTPQLKEAKAALNAALAQLQTAQNNLQRTRYKQPFAGRVVESALAQGQYVVAGQSYGQLYALEALEIRVPMNDRETAWLLEAQRPAITVYTTYLDEPQSYAAHIKRVAAERDPQTRFGQVTLGFDNPDQALIPGVFVDIEVKGPQRDNVWRLPLNTLQEGQSIWIVDSDNRLKELMPRILYIGDDHILTEAPRTRARVVTGSLSGATAGTKVRIEKAEGQAD